MAYDGNSSGTIASTNFTSTAQALLNFAGALQVATSTYAGGGNTLRHIFYYVTVFRWRSL